MEYLRTSVFELYNNELPLSISHQYGSLNALNDIHLLFVLEVDDLDYWYRRSVIDSCELNVSDAVFFVMVFGDHDESNAWHSDGVLDREYEKSVGLLVFGTYWVVGVEVCFLFCHLCYVLQILFCLRFAHDCICYSLYDLLFIYPKPKP